MTTAATSPPGIYVHVPFCAALCHYCDFNRVAGSTEAERQRYVAALLAEIARVAEAGPAGVAPPAVREDDAAQAVEGWPVFGSIFVGGGTPTLLDAEDLGAVLRRLHDLLPVDAAAEVTVEVNPETVDEAVFTTLCEAGVNRVSMGAQSFAPHVLDALGRWHDPLRPLAAVEAAGRAGIERVSLDLIYGTPGETDADWAATLDTALSTDVRHVSAYALTVEASTEYAARIRRGAVTAPDDDVQADRMAAADARLVEAGLRRYEISNWAVPGQESRHNLVYWRGGDWLAFGAGAHGHWQGRRWWAFRPPGRYADAALAGEPTLAGAEELDEEQRREERLLMGLRLAEGVPRAEIEPIDEAGAARMVSGGLLADDGRRLRLTGAGWPLAGSVLLALLHTGRGGGD